ncbi:hypothetical protein ABT275_05825 [Streptomyces sp. NPDC001185]|uniref:hypothetical protein n=1 Tax=Streptomyces sp. NPDC001185 TaxID=3154380 RepID=UPI00331D7AFB
MAADDPFTTEPPEGRLLRFLHQEVTHRKGVQKNNTLSFFSGATDRVTAGWSATFV